MLSGEDFGYLKNTEQNRVAIIAKKAFLLGSVLFSIVCFIYITANAYYFAYQDKDGGIKVIKSPEEPIKIVEENEGLNIKNIDKTIYDNIVGNNKLTNENLNNVTILEHSVAPSVKAVIVKNPDPIISSATEPVKKTPINSSAMMVYDANKTSDITNDASLVEKKAEVKNVENKKIKGLSRVQLAALASKDSAIGYWKKLSSNYPRLFSGLNYFISEVNLGAKGTFYRLQIGNFRNQVDAEKFCREFIFESGKTKADCIIVE